MSYDIYAEVYAIENLLVDEGLAGRSRRLQLAIDQGSTGTEVLMALRFEIEQTMASEHVSDIMEVRMKRICREISSVLGDA